MDELTLTQENFDEFVLKATLPVVVDFWAPWCVPCKIQNPILEEFAKQMKGKALVGKVNVDENQELAGAHGVMSIPTIKIYHKGVAVVELIGVQTKEKLISELKKIAA